MVKKTSIKRKPKKSLKRKPVSKAKSKKPVVKPRSRSAIARSAPKGSGQRLSAPGGKQSMKTASKKPPARKKPFVGAGEKIIGEITHYFPKVRAGVVKLTAPLNTGDTIKIKGHSTDFTQQVISMQIDRSPITAAKKGDEIGLLVENRVRKKDIVIKIKI